MTGCSRLAAPPHRKFGSTATTHFYFLLVFLFLAHIFAAGPWTVTFCEKVTKSSMDWDTYKAAEGIEGEMQQATKDGKGYLNKQDFLQRCDVRKFENELEVRNAKRDA